MINFVSIWDVGTKVPEKRILCLVSLPFDLFAKINDIVDCLLGLLGSLCD